MNFVEIIVLHGEHLHVGSKLLDEGVDDGGGGEIGGDADALRRHFGARILEIKPHHSVELEHWIRLLGGKGGRKKYGVDR